MSQRFIFSLYESNDAGVEDIKKERQENSTDKNIFAL